MDKKSKIKEELKKKLKQETSVTGTGASVTPGGDFVATKYAFGKHNNKGTPKDWKSAPSIPNRKSKAMDYKELWEIERDQKVKIVKGSYAGRTAVVHDFDTDKDIASGEDWVDVIIDEPTKPKKTVKASELKPLKESSDKIHIATDTKTDSDIYFDSSTGEFFINVIDGAGNRWNKLQVNTIDDVIAKFPALKWTKEGMIEFQPEEQGDNEDSYDWFTGKYNEDMRQDDSTDKILTYLQAAKQQGKLSPDAQNVLIQWMNSPGASREEIIKVLRQLTGMYLKEEEVSEAKQEWAVKNIEALINDYAAGKKLIFKPVDKQQQVSQYGSKKTIYIYKLGDKDLIMVDDKAAGAPRLNDFRVAIGTIEPGTTSLKNALSISKFGSWGTSDIITMLDKAFGEKLNEGYAQFRNETKMRSKPDQFHQAVKQVKKKVNEINRLFEYMDRLKTELSEGESELKYKKYTENALSQIKEATKKLFFKSTKLK